MRLKLLVVGPVPPPVHGPAVSTSLILASDVLRERFQIIHLDTSDHRSRTNMGRWDLRNIVLGLRNVAQLGLQATRREKGVVYLPISQSAAGFVRDSLFVQVAHLCGWRVVIHLRGSEFRSWYEDAGSLLRAWIRRTIRVVDSAAVMSQSLRGQFDGLLPHDRVAVVPNGTPDLARDGVRPVTDTVLFLSNLRARKGVIEAVDTAVQVLEGRPTTQFIFAGDWSDPHFEKTVRARAKAAGDRIRFLPTVEGETKRELLLTASVLLFPPVEPEGHPRVVLEALSAGLPVVATNRGAIADTVVDGESGFVVDDPVPAKLAERVELLLADAPLRERMSRAARRRYTEHFTMDHADSRLADWLTSVAAR